MGSNFSDLGDKNDRIKTVLIAGGASLLILAGTLYLLHTNNPNHSDHFDWEKRYPVQFAIIENFYKKKMLSLGQTKIPSEVITALLRDECNLSK